MDAENHMRFAILCSKIHVAESRVMDSELNKGQKYTYIFFGMKAM